VPRVDPRFTVEIVVIFGCLHEEAVIEVDHALRHQRIPLLGDSIPVAALILTFHVYKLQVEVIEPEGVRLVPKFFESRLEYPSLPLGLDFFIRTVSIFVLYFS
jgi:hypothetical protein